MSDIRHSTSAQFRVEIMNEFAPQDSSANKPAQSAENQFPEANYTARTVANDNSKSEVAYKWLVKGGLAVVAIAFVFGMKMYNKSSASDDAKKQLHQAYAGHPEAARIEQLINQHHERCFDASYKVGGRRSSDKFDVDKYVSMMQAAIETDLTGNDGLQQLLAIKRAEAEARAVEDPLSAVDPHNQIDRLNELYEAGHATEKSTVSPAFEVSEESATQTAN